jgi:hypothetical protein
MTQPLIPPPVPNCLASFSSNHFVDSELTLIALDFRSDLALDFLSGDLAFFGIVLALGLQPFRWTSNLSAKNFLPQLGQG